MARKVFSAGFVDDVGAEVERILEEGGEHGVVHGDEAFGVGGVGEGGQLRYVDDFDQGIGRRFEEEHSGFGVEDGGDFRGGGGVDVVDYYSAVRREVFEQAVGAAVEIVAGDNFVAGSEEAGYDVQCAHSRGNDKSSLSRHNLREVPF